MTITMEDDPSGREAIEKARVAMWDEVAAKAGVRIPSEPNNELPPPPLVGRGHPKE